MIPEVHSSAGYDSWKKRENYALEKWLQGKLKKEEKKTNTKAPTAMWLKTKDLDLCVRNKG